MNLDRIEAFKKFEKQISENPDELTSKILDRINYLKQNLLPRDEYVETLDEPLKSNMKANFAKGAMLSRIRATCNDEDITKVLSEEYLRMNASCLMKDLMIIMSNKEKGNPLDNPLEGLYENFKEIYEQNADKIAACRAELGLPNPFSDFKPYSVSSE